MFMFLRLGGGGGDYIHLALERLNQRLTGNEGEA